MARRTAVRLIGPAKRVERTEAYAPDALRAQRREQRHLAAGLIRAERREDGDRVVLQPPHRELECPGTRPIEPLHVVDRQQHWHLRRQLGQERDEGGPDRPRVRGAFLGLGPEQRDVEPSALGCRETGKRVGPKRGEQIPQPRERQAGFRVRRSAREHAIPLCLGAAGGLVPDRRLADAGLPLEHQ